MYNKQIYNTLAFKDIFKDYNEFINTYKDSVIFDGIDLPSERTFQLIFNEYATSNVASTKESFIRRFENVLYERFEQFEADIQLKGNARDGSIDFKDGGGMIENIAAAPNNEGTTHADIIQSLDQQTRITTDEGKVAEYSRKMMYNRPYIIRQFLNQFRSLFIKLIAIQSNPTWTSDGSGYLINEEGERIW